MKRLFDIYLESLEEINMPDKQLVTVAWHTDRVATFGKEISFEEVDDFRCLLESMVQFAMTNDLLNELDIEYIRYLLDGKH